MIIFSRAERKKEPPASWRCASPTIPPKAPATSMHQLERTSISQGGHVMSSCHHIEGRSQDHTVMAGYDHDEQTYF
ncbi:MAG: hypothetical protein ACR2RE_11410, partial [Geminicoccaceae bacterium]